MYALDADLLDMAWYKDGKLALLCQRPAESDLPPRSWLLLADAQELDFAALPPDCPSILQVPAYCSQLHHLLVYSISVH